MISPEIATQMLQNALESNQGLAAVAQGQSSAGLYNSTTNKLLTNDLLARLTANIAEKAAPTVESISPTTQTAKVANTVPSLKGQMPTLAALTLGKPLLDKASKGKSLYDVVNNISDFVTPAATLPAAESISSLGGLPAASAAPGSVLDSLSATSQISPVVYDALAATPAADAVSSALSSTAVADTAGTAAGTSALAEGATADSLLGATATETAIDSGILGGVGSEIGAAAGLGTAAELAAGAADAGVLATAGFAAAEGGSVLAEALPLVLGWVICTELQDSGELPNELYLAGALRTINLPASVIRGYQWWAIPYTRLMRRSTLARKFIKPFAIARASYIATGKFNLAGWLSVVIGEPICAILGHTVARKKQNWEELYIG